MSDHHQLIRAGNDLVRLRNLLLAGVYPNSQDSSGRTPLHVAILNAEINPQEIDEIVAVVHELIYFGANVNIANNSGRTPLHYAVACRNCRLIEILLQANADINEKDGDAYAALHYATSRRTFRTEFIYETDVNVVKLLLKYNPDIDIRTNNNETPLMLAVQDNNLQIIRELLENNASVHLQDSNGSSVMFYALRRLEMNVNLVMELFRHGCSFNVTNPFGMTPMNYYINRLQCAFMLQRELDSAKPVFKLFVFEGNYLNENQRRIVTSISNETKCQLSRFVELCGYEVARMRRDELEPNFTVYDLALKGVFCRISRNTNHIPFPIFDKMLAKLIRGEYPVYSDLIVSAICNPYMNLKYAEVCSCVIRKGEKDLNFDEFYIISSDLSNFDMLNMMIACSRRRRRPWYLPRFLYNTRCSVS